MREIFTSGTVGGALGNQCFYPEIRILLLSLLKKQHEAKPPHVPFHGS